MSPRAIPSNLKKEIWRLPCAICSRNGDIEVDHIIPVSAGGGRSRDNLQPLCRVCNGLKNHRRSNDSVKDWINLNWEKFINRQQSRDSRTSAQNNHWRFHGCRPA